jgi:hypothetical protein
MPIFPKYARSDGILAQKGMTFSKEFPTTPKMEFLRGRKRISALKFIAAAIGK